MWHGAGCPGPGIGHHRMDARFGGGTPELEKNFQLSICHPARGLGIDEKCVTMKNVSPDFTKNTPCEDQIAPAPNPKNTRPLLNSMSGVASTPSEEPLRHTVHEVGSSIMVASSLNRMSCERYVRHLWVSEKKM